MLLQLHCVKREYLTLSNYLIIIIYITILKIEVYKYKD